MNKLSRNLAFFLLITSIVLPIFPAITVAQDDEPIIFRGATSSTAGDWDLAISDGYSLHGLHYWPAACEYPAGGNADFFGGVYKPLVDDWKPILCTSWSMEYWPSENNSLGFFNTGGNMAMTLTLRNGVKFHDGSNWNATVMKWNIDRRYIITGNLTGKGDQRNRDTYWAEVNNVLPYNTPGWNLSSLDATDATTIPFVPPNISQYAGYYIGNETTYPGVTAVDGWVYNPNPYGGWDSDAQNFIHYAPYDKYPLIRYVEILDNAASGGTIKVHYNSWNSYGMEGGLYARMISYHSYHKNYTAQGIYGYTNGVKDPKNPTIVDHMIGTGPYVYVEHDETGSPAGGYMTKFEDYWNKTALEADGWFDVDVREVVNFPAGELGRDALNTALLTHSIDYCYDQMNQPIDYVAVKKNKNIDYIDDDPTEYKTQITLNCINESAWWIANEAWRTGTGPTDYPSDKLPAGGVPRALREAMTYAFNYDLMINTVLEGRAVRGGGLISTAAIYYNASVNLPGYDLAKARNILLTTEEDNFTQTPTAFNYNFSQLCADRGLTAGSSDAEWENIANTNPIFTFNYFWDSAHEDLKGVLQTSLAKIGVALKDKTGANNRVTGIVWDTVQTYWLSTFPGGNSIWSANAWVMDYHLPHTIPEGWIDANYDDESFEYWPAWNFNFNYDAEVAYWIDRMYMSSPDQKIQWISKIAEKEQNELFPFIYAYQRTGGFCLWKDWEGLMVPGRFLNRTFYWGVFSIHLLRYVGLPEEYPLIPGAPLLITLCVSAISMIGIVYSLMRKKKL